MKKTTKTLFIYSFVAIVIVSINLFFDLKEYADLVLELFAVLLVAVLISFGRPIKDANYFQNLVYLLSLGIFMTNLKPIINVLF
jgi:hypothetical protein